MRLHVLTAVTRPENFNAIYNSIYDSNHHDWQIYWHLLHLDGDHIGGQKVKNLLFEVLDDEQDGWVYVLDDDTLMHPAFLSRTAALINANPEADVFFFARVDHGNVFQPDVKVGSIDIGQALIHLSLVGDLRLPELYDGDGWFLEGIRQAADQAVYVNEPLSFYNRLR